MEVNGRFKVGQFLCFLLSFGFFVPATMIGTRQDANAIKNFILTNYTTDTLPIDDQSGILYINASFYLRSIIDLDEPKGELTTTLALFFEWQDEGLKWNGWEFGHVYIIRLEKSKIWTPSFFLGNSGSSTDSGSLAESRSSVVYDGKVTDFRAMVTNTICDIDVTYYPFDIQKCDIMFETSDYGANVKLRVIHPTMDLSTFIENGVWSLSKTEITTSTDHDGYTHYLRATVFLERRSLFYVLNFLAPILILMLLNSMVFVLPTDSGERVGFSVTILLSIAVYMTIVSDKLPETSNPTSVLSYILIIYLLQSASICLETIASLRFFHRNDSKPVNSGWMWCVTCMQCSVRKYANEEYHVDNGVTKYISDDEQYKTDACGVTQQNTSMRKDNVTWTNVSKALDTLFLILNICISVALAVSYFVVVYTRPKI